jgi:anhydro-N-acetylmuramic acid kinase
VGFLNLGGIANMTVVAPGKEPVAYDLGPANTLMDAAIVRFTDGRASCDHDGNSAAAGNVHDGLMARLLEHAYYRLPIPKSTGKETFGNDYLQAVLSEFPDAGMNDVLATLTAHAGKLVADEAKAHGLVQLVASGGGVNNPTLVACIKENLDTIAYTTIDELGVPADAKEAYAFALLGFLTAVGLPGTISSCTGANHSVVLGTITPGSAECLFPYVQSTQVPGDRTRQVPMRLKISSGSPGA